MSNRDVSDCMKPCSLATIILRFAAIWLILSALVTGIEEIMLATSLAGIPVFSGDQGPLTEFILGRKQVGPILTKSTITAIVGVLIYIWSKPLGKLIARDLP